MKKYLLLMVALSAVALIGSAQASTVYYGYRTYPTYYPSNQMTFQYHSGSTYVNFGYYRPAPYYRPSPYYYVPSYTYYRQPSCYWLYGRYYCN